MINILLVDDSAVIKAILKQILTNDPRFNIVGEASNGSDAITKNSLLHPDLIIMDINMPVMNGIEATKIIMTEAPTNIVIFSTEDTAQIGFSGINAGAKEIIPKPNLSSMSAAFYESFKEKLYLLGSKTTHKKMAEKPVVQKTENDDYNIVMVGASTGGPAAVQTLLKNLGPNLSAPILLTQHIDASFADHYTPWLSETTGLDVKFAQDGQICEKGKVYVAPPDYHMTIEGNSESGHYKIKLNQDKPVHFLRPAVDPMFFSGASVAGKHCIGILLTGMGRDGADGCIELKKADAYTICESEETCAVFGMPKAAIDEGGAKTVLPVYAIGEYVYGLLGK